MEKAVVFLKWTAKAGLTAVAVVVSYLTAILTGDQTIQDVTQVQWLVCLGLVLAAWGVVYRVPNGPAPVSTKGL